MARRDKLEEAAGCSLEFLDPRYDGSILGVAVRGGTDNPVVCYGYQAAKALLLDTYPDPARIYAELTAMRNMRSADVLWLVRYSRKVMWDIIERNSYKLWESLNTSVIGIGYSSGDPGVVYNKALCLSTLEENTIASNANVDSLSDSMKFFEKSVEGISLQENTPWFLTPVK